MKIIGRSENSYLALTKGIGASGELGAALAKAKEWEEWKRQQ